MKNFLKKALQTHESASSSSQAKKNKKKGNISYPKSARSTQAELVKNTTFESPSAPPAVPGLDSSSSMPYASDSTMNDPATALYWQSTFEHPRNPPPIPGGNKSKDKETSYPPTLPQSDMAGRSGTGTFETHWAPLAVSNTDPVDGAGLSDDQDRRSSHSRDIIYATDSFVFTDFIALEEVQQARSDGQMYDLGPEQDSEYGA